MTEYLSEWEGNPRIIYLLDYEKTKQEHMELLIMRILWSYGLQEIVLKSM